MAQGHAQLAFGVDDVGPVSYTHLDVYKRQAKYHEVAERHDTLHVVGMCLGALLAVELCKRVQHRKGKLVSLLSLIHI